LFCRHVRTHPPIPLEGPCVIDRVHRDHSGQHKCNCNDNLN
jgi:hypothetical protein